MQAVEVGRGDGFSGRTWMWERRRSLPYDGPRRVDLSCSGRDQLLGRHSRRERRGRLGRNGGSAGRLGHGKQRRTTVFDEGPVWERPDRSGRPKLASYSFVKQSSSASAVY
ncbi:unnamed protein product [Angiostrongylus costaricensis]|uniref:Uncharacterized protein n=1 Tax=Angiostrongylus costaricensis TaxID=334426 RepID=A0A0R3PAW9_ANGCS|nr:unnamed protein product [Angiostrongylus costaricensis]